MRLRAETPSRRWIPVVLAAIAMGAVVAGCDRPPERSASAKPELTPTTPAVGAPPAQPAPVMPPKADTVFEAPSGSQTTRSADSGGDQHSAADAAANGSDPNAKQPMSKDEESTAMPKPAQANDHSTTATDGKQ